MTFIIVIPFDEASPAGGNETSSARQNCQSDQDSSPGLFRIRCGDKSTTDDAKPSSIRVSFDPSKLLDPSSDQSSDQFTLNGSGHYSNDQKGCLGKFGVELNC